MNKKQTDSRIAEEKAALYIRVSTKYQVDKDSLPVQREELINYAKYALGIDKYDVFEDAGYSAKNTERPAFQQMMARLRTGEFSHLCVYKIDRISRNLIDFAEMYSEIKKLGITFVSKNEQFDTSSAMGEAMLKIILVFAELERNMTSERVTAVMLARASNGQWNGGRVPFGYSYDKSTGVFSIIDSEASTVKLIYELYERHQSLLVVAHHLNSHGLYHRTGRWTPKTVSTVLKSPFYTGAYRYNYYDESRSGGKTSGKYLKNENEWIIVKDHHEPIVSEDRQQRIVHILRENNRYTQRDTRVYYRTHLHIFSGLMICGECGSQMHSAADNPRKDGYRPSLYICGKKRRFKDCDSKQVSDITVAPFVLNYIANIIKAQNNIGRTTPIDTFERKLLRGKEFSNVEHIEEAGLVEMYEMLRKGNLSDTTFVPSGNSGNENGESGELELLENEKRKRERALSRLMSLYLFNDEAMSEKDYLIEKQAIEQQIKELNERIETIVRDNAEKRRMSDGEFMSRASLFIMTHQLKQRRFIEFEKIIKYIDPIIIKEFVNSIISKIVIKNARIDAIRFRNGIEHHFLYKD